MQQTKPVSKQSEVKEMDKTGITLILGIASIVLGIATIIERWKN